MFRVMVRQSIGFWSTMVVVIVCAVPTLLHGQGTALSRQGGLTPGASFAGIEESLSKAADALLAAGSLQTAESELSSRAPAVHDDQQARPRKNTGRIASLSRLDSLRPMVEPILRESGVPVEMAAVILIESGGRSAALSPKGALGIWQLMPDTARRYGLQVNHVADERLDTAKSTRAAAHYLSDLHLQFGSWAMTLAAYNTGEQNVQRAISRSRSTDFDVLSSLHLLSFETRNYVPRVLAVIQSPSQPLALEEYKRAANTTTVFASSNR